MEITVAGSAVVDLASKDDLKAHHERIERILPRKQEGKYFRLQGQGQVPAAGVGNGNQQFAFVPASPPAGSRWFVEWFTVVQQAFDPLAALAGVVHGALCIGKCATGPGAANMLPTTTITTADIVVPLPLFTSGANIISVPGSAAVPDKTIVYDNEQLYILLTGGGIGGGGTIYQATAGVVEVPDLDETLFW